MTIEPTPDDSYVYEKAWPLVREWRMLRRNLPAEGRTLSWMQRQERLLKVEIALLNEHRLTLPPDAQPIDDQWRRHVTNWRLNDLARGPEADCPSEVAPMGPPAGHIWTVVGLDAGRPDSAVESSCKRIEKQSGKACRTIQGARGKTGQNPLATRAVGR